MVSFLIKKRDVRLAVWLLAVSFASTVEAAVDEGNPYHPIVAKNIFKLQDPPRLKQVETELPPLAKVALTGITTILPRPLALLEWSEPGQQKKNYSTLTEGQGEGPIEILRIDDKAGSVTIKNHGVTMTLTFEQNGAKPASVIQTRELRLPPPPNPLETLK